MVGVVNDPTTTYRGVPVRVHGEAVCTLCTFSKGARDVAQLERLAARAGKLLEDKSPAPVAEAVAQPTASAVAAADPAVPSATMTAARAATDKRGAPAEPPGGGGAPETAVPRAVEPRRAAAPPRVAPAPADDVRSWLAARRLDAFADGLAALGVEIVDDLVDVTDEDAAGLGLNRVQRNRLRRELADWLAEDLGPRARGLLFLQRERLVVGSDG